MARLFLVQPLRPGSIFADRYEILELLGGGGMGQVYRALQLPLCKEVALKVLVAQASGDFELRFEREAHAIARLDHPSCVRIVDFGRAADRQYIAMELVRGPTLAAVLAAEPRLASGRALAIARDVLDGLDHAHARGVVHRDIKPDNIVLSPRGAVIIDFGLACLAGEGAFTQNGMCIGSPSYVAPERLLGKPADARADVYAVGVILYEMLAGVRPFVGATSREVMEHALHRAPRPLHAHCPGISPALEAVVHGALARDPAGRFATATALCDALGPEEGSAASSTIIRIPISRPSWWLRLRSWLAYGTWRWGRA